MPEHPLLAVSPERGALRLALRARTLRSVSVITCTLLLVACASSGGRRSQPPRPGAAPAWEVDGPGLSPPADLANVPDAEPTVEAMRSGPMRPYEIKGRSYVPITEDIAHFERGLASWYGRKFHGRATASGETYDMYAMSAAHPTLPLPSFVRVRNPANQREVIVRVNDRGPFHPGRIIDLSYTAAFKLDLLRGVAPVEIERITNREIVAGSWQRGSQRSVAVASAQRVEPIRRLHRTAPAVGIGPRPERVAPPPVQTPGDVVGPAAADAVVGITAPAPGTEAMLPGALAPPPGAASALPMAEADRMARAASGEVDGYWVQLGAFRFRDGAENFQRQVVSDLSWIAPALTVRSEAELHRLQAGPYADREQAANVAQRLRDSLQLVPVIVERR